MILALQIILLVLWYAIPGAAALPAWLVFLPTIIFLIWFLLFVIIVALSANEERAWRSWRP